MMYMTSGIEMTTIFGDGSQKGGGLRTASPRLRCRSRSRAYGGLMEEVVAVRRGGMGSDPSEDGNAFFRRGWPGQPSSPLGAVWDFERSPMGFSPAPWRCFSLSRRNV